MNNTSRSRPISVVIESLDTIIKDLNDNPIKTRMRAILITELQKVVALAREVIRVEGDTIYSHNTSA